jgi:hypothetical protein
MRNYTRNSVGPTKSRGKRKALIDENLTEAMGKGDINTINQKDKGMLIEIGPDAP